jgi:polysaccharide export outer membrane protein
MIHVHTVKKIGVAILLLTLCGCATLGLNPQVLETIESTTFQVSKKAHTKRFATPEVIRELTKEKLKNEDYRLGPGDIMDISVWKRAEISGENVVVAPDGIISVPKVGVINVTGKTIPELTYQIRDTLARSYENPEVTITVREFHNNKAFVLGRVSEPGVVNFPGNGTLLEALALAGGLPHIGKDTFLTKCAIIRGNDTVIWIDLRELLDYGNMALNARILNNDVIFIPEAEDEMIMVLGEVANPGPILLKRGLNLVDAVMRAGGYTDAADLEKVFIIRSANEEGIIRQINLKAIFETGNFDENYALLQNDIIYIGPSGMRKFNYALEQLLPSLQVLSLSTAVLDSLGITEKVFNIQTSEPK